MINDAELQRRRKRYHASCAAFMFDFKWRGKTWCIDASREDGSYGRIVNDDHKHPNCKMKKIDVNGKPHLCLFALDDIKEGEEIAYDYGGENYPWRTQMTSAAVNTSTASNSDPSLQSETQMDDESAQINSPQQMTSAAVNTSTASNSDPSLQSETQMDDESAQINSPQQMTSAAVNTSTASNSDPSLQSETQMDDESAQINSPQQIVIQLRNENDILVPRLRRTKSIMMKDMDLQDSGELFDSTPESSDNYVPDTTSDSDSDVSLTLNPTKRQLLDELDMNESASVSFPDCDTTTSDKMHSLTSKASGTVEEPSSSQNTIDCVVVNAYQKRDGGRVYNKRHYCLYCSKPYAKMARHLESSHANTSDVARALSFPKGSKERKNSWIIFATKGTMPTMLLLWNQEMGNWCHLNDHLKKHRERISCIVRTVKDFLQERSCGVICVLVDFNLSQSPPNQEKTVFSPCVHTRGLCLQT
ncbi:clumping factor A-like isoform X5 [Xyrauchen texanus]|uniref:clumping factor A-like isoform X2 n=2 Tax=Xyrauchen texanus TaxID=154827 RepID=UPI002241CE4C|nr:clumping factor A-like isoform X2 [Xyrauchen texanus]XP_051998351.1 clumping factor A-like isoform X3 [Xyrauchen texanus]XP_051998352.1 clumping factor A-like isoform X4 [Xyrauchen texanus]XP_051998353.1 clumping factor A-like isoform X5 [Xyrauchen texanus]